jgi:putative hydrolase of the HAD superfamily
VEAFDRLVAAHGIVPKSTAFFEDAQHNLAPAAALGMTTVLVGRDEASEPFIDFATGDLACFLAAAQLKETR